MRVLFVPYPARTHIHHQVPLARAFLTAGHDVRVAVQPEWIPDIVAAGLPAVRIGDPMAWWKIFDNLPSADPAVTGLDLSEFRPGGCSFQYLYTRFTVMATYPLHEVSVQPVVDELVAVARSWRPHLVLWDEAMFAAPIAARACGAAHGRLLTSLDLLGQMRVDFLAMLACQPAARRHDPFREWLGWNLQRFGCSFGEDVVVGQFSLNTHPPSLQYPLPNQLQLRYVPYYGGAELPRDGQPPARRRRVCLTFGLSLRDATGTDAENVTDLLDAVAGVDAEVVATLNLGQMDPAPVVPGNVRIVDFVPMNSLLPTCAAIVHHGGAGTGLCAALHGVPQILIPDGSWDTTPRAEAMRQLGAGGHLRRQTFRPEDLRGELNAVLDEQAYVAGAATLRSEMLSAPAPAELVPRISELTRKLGTS
ncbi:activator-dependent family glycosyltransferase [Phytoactinopolyspora limicola]|uniref:activator-dependent family glycosyltransferase n=1 Tax=Phytoactinopolyspora limicola TaxID=2715536 RepID=UPI0014082F3B|nr:activator-dependent family glycosyltransferase [Phytoactinopolyspora limicola]